MISHPELVQIGRLLWHTHVFDKYIVDLTNYPPFQLLKGYSISNQIQEVNFIERSVILIVYFFKTEDYFDINMSSINPS
jgi:hypothetical protein